MSGSRRELRGQNFDIWSILFFESIPYSTHKRTIFLISSRMLFGGSANGLAVWSSSWVSGDRRLSIFFISFRLNPISLSFYILCVYKTEFPNFCYLM